MTAADHEHSDILERLRSVGNGDTWSSYEVVALINQAADEIERLRALLNRPYDKITWGAYSEQK